MKKTKKIILRTVSKLVERELENNVYSWPPHCMGIFHQPKRPTVRKKSNEVRKDSII